MAHEQLIYVLHMVVFHCKLLVYQRVMVCFWGRTNCSWLMAQWLHHSRESRDFFASNLRFGHLKWWYMGHAWHRFPVIKWCKYVWNCMNILIILLYYLADWWINPDKQLYKPRKLHESIIPTHWPLCCKLMHLYIQIHIWGSFKKPAFPVLIVTTYSKINLSLEVWKHDVRASGRKGERKLFTTMYYYYYFYYYYYRRLGSKMQGLKHVWNRSETGLKHAWTKLKGIYPSGPLLIYTRHFLIAWRQILLWLFIMLTWDLSPEKCKQHI
jgi:hypothetical protein